MPFIMANARFAVHNIGGDTHPFRSGSGLRNVARGKRLLDRRQSCRPLQTSGLRIFACPPPLCRVEFHIDCFALPHIMCANHRRRRVAGESYGMLVVNCISGKNLSQCFKRATHADAGILGRVQVDFRCGYVRMTQQILDVADADAARQQVRRETVPQRVG